MFLFCFLYNFNYGHHIFLKKLSPVSQCFHILNVFIKSLEKYYFFFFVKGNQNEQIILFLIKMSLTKHIYLPVSKTSNVYSEVANYFKYVYLS